MSTKDFIQDFIGNPIILPLILICFCFYIFILIGSPILKGLYKIQVVKKSITYLFVVCLFQISLIGMTLSFLDRWIRYGGTLTSYITTFSINFFCLFFLQEIGLMRINRFIGIISKNPLLIALSLIILLSPAWSEMPIVGLTASIGYLLALLITVQMAEKYTWLELDEILRIGLSVVGVLTLVSAALSPSSYFTTEPWGALIGGRKNFGILCGLITSLWLLNWLGSKKADWLSPICACFFSIFVILGNSITGLITLMACLYALFLTSSSRFLKRKESLRILSVLGPISIFVVSIFISNFPRVAIFFGKDPTFTGRTLIWEVLIEKVNNYNALLGYGYNGFWQVWRGSDSPGYNIKPDLLGDYVAPHAHNGFVEVFIQLGYLGLIIFILLFLQTSYKAVQKAYSAKGKEQRLPLLLITFLIFSNIGETFQLGMIGPNINLFILVILAIKLNPKQDRRSITAYNPYLKS
ncbi:O-antigen ligase family protein [Pseudanabaena sp. FACHB-2040]|uniref:O-antigen ligase family protein n=1 Tax=Pseudanabaena sp. FACHB-2040 TaxID=2692859 RepID=UPI001688200F|nr:O-antigen ligase family protein [Pseudanabaena sp. FACHB-2040]MBD2260597.1 O-antigen ligase family protein [Pseudanabaena sp. FACHB-2040]